MEGPLVGTIRLVDCCLQGCAMRLREDGAAQAFDSGHLPLSLFCVSGGRLSISGAASNNGCELPLKAQQSLPRFAR